jgi:hypothetical protein
VAIAKFERGHGCFISALAQAKPSVAAVSSFAGERCYGQATEFCSNGAWLFGGVCHAADCIQKRSKNL